MVSASSSTQQRSRKGDGRRQRISLAFLGTATSTTGASSSFRRTPLWHDRRLAIPSYCQQQPSTPLTIRGGSDFADQDEDLGILSTPYLDSFQEEVHDIVATYRAEVRRTFQDMRMQILTGRPPPSSEEDGDEDDAGESFESSNDPQEEEMEGFSDFQEEDDDVEFVIGDTDEDDDHVLERLSHKDEPYYSEGAEETDGEEDYGVAPMCETKDSEALEAVAQGQPVMEETLDGVPSNAMTESDEGEAVPQKKKKKKRKKGRKKKKKEVAFVEDELKELPQDQLVIDDAEGNESAGSQSIVLAGPSSQSQAITTSQFDLGKSMVTSFTAAVFFILINLAWRILLKAFSKAPG